MKLSSDAWQLWAKTPSKHAREAEELGIRAWLALPQHLRDAADVGERLVTEWLPRQLQERLAGIYGGDLEQASQLVGLLCGVHDVGKADLVFQGQLDGSSEHGWLWDQVRALPSCPRLKGGAPEPKPQHAEVSDLILRRCFARFFPEANPAATRSVAVTAGCHHGRLGELGPHTGPGGGRAHQLSLWLDSHGAAWAQLWDEMVEDIMERTGARNALDHVLLEGGLGIADQVMLCGLVTMADWIASNQELFPLSESGRHDIEASRANRALEQLNLTRAWEPVGAAAPPFKRRFGWPEGASLRPCQSAAVEAAADSKGPRLVVIEEEMGQGKTEAALLVAEVIAGQCGGGGVAFALPTMATADSMFSRVKSWVETLETDSSVPHSLFLGHSRSWLEPRNEKLIRQTRAVGARGGQSVVAHEWFTGKKGMLAEFTVSTVDQVLMAALSTRYVTMRHLGLAGKVVILDEVHSYDVFTSSYMERTLTWLAAHGVSVVLLSATLASGLRCQLENAYRTGLGANPRPHPDAIAGPVEPQARGKLAARAGTGGSRGTRDTGATTSVPAYPRISVTGATGTHFTPISARSTHRRVQMNLVRDDLESLVHLVASHAEDGGVVGLVCNTVSRAQEAYEHFVEHFGEDVVELHHSQFTAGDRSEREQRLVTELGPAVHRGAGRPARRVLVGTQVLEQSLDIDLDLLVTDLAPADSLAQRAGRLHRHERPETDRPSSMREAMVYVRGVDASGGLPEFEAGARAIYGDRVLLSTFAVMQPYLRGEPWCLTHELEAVVEEIYRGDVRVPDSWQKTYEVARAKENKQMGHAQNRAETFQLVAPAESRGDMRRVLERMIASDADRSDSLAAAHVRDIEPSLEVLVIQEQDGLLSPLPWILPAGAGKEGWFLSETAVPPPRFARAVAMSTLRLPRWLVAPWELEQAIAELEAVGMRAWQEDFRLRGQLVIRLDERLHGRILGKAFGYDRGVGIHRLDEVDPDGGLLNDIEDFDVWDTEEEEGFR